MEFTNMYVDFVCATVYLICYLELKYLIYLVDNNSVLIIYNWLFWFVMFMLEIVWCLYNFTYLFNNLFAYVYYNNSVLIICS